MKTDILTAGGLSLALRRPDGSLSLKAWDAADEQLLEQTFSRYYPDPRLRVLVVDDRFGALTLGLARFAPASFSDSHSLGPALTLNGAERDAVALPSDWRSPPQGPFDLVVMRIPRQVDYLGCLLRWINGLLAPGGTLIAGGMIKHLPDTCASVFGDLVRTREVCPARKKARVIVAGAGEPTLTGWAGLWKGYPLPGVEPDVEALPAVFAREKLDRGTGLLLPYVAEQAVALEPGARVLDLACGNGVLGLAALSANPRLAVTLVDVSSQAVVSARANLMNAFPDAEAVFHHSDGIPETTGVFDLVLLNPPFHEGGVVGDHIALRLFRQVARHLAPGGLLLMVGNRHLGYHQSLRRFFSQLEQLQEDPRFVVFRASGPSGQGAGRS